MKEIMQWSISIWNQYWGNGYVQYLLLIAVVYLLLRKRNTHSIRQVLPYLFLILFLFLCPITAKIIQTCIGHDVYWRVLWLLPAASVIALACAEFLHTRKILHTRKKIFRALTALLFAATILLCGKSLLDSGQYVQVHNYQKVPDEVAHICNIIREDAGNKKVRLVTDENISPYVRVYDPSIRMPYGRRGRGAITWTTIRLYKAVHPEEGRVKYKRIARLAKEANCNYMAIVMNDKFKLKYVKKFGYEQIGTVNNYGIFRLNKKSS